MIRILDHKTRPEGQHTGKGQGKSDVVAEVTFLDHDGAAHTLTFLPAGTVIPSEDEEPDRIVGEDVPHYSFATAQEAVNAYQNGEVV